MLINANAATGTKTHLSGFSTDVGKPLLTVHLKPSKWLANILIAAHSAAAIIFVLLPIPGYAQLVSIAVLVVSLFVYVRRDALLLASQSVIMLEFDNEMACKLFTKHDRIVPCFVLGSTFVSPYLTVLILQSERRWFTHSVIILPDSISSETFRRLRVLLRWQWKQ